MQPATEESLFQSGIKALQAGNGHDAKATFQNAISQGFKSSRIWLGLALANIARRDTKAAEQAIDQVLALEPNNLRALIIKGDIVFARQEMQAAAAHYGLALRLSAALSNPPPVVIADLKRIARRQQEISQRFQEHLMDQLANVGYRRTTASERFNKALDMLLGKLERPLETRSYPQSPHTFYMPDLPYHTFFPREELAWLDELESQTDVIQSELEALLAKQQHSFKPYIHSGIDRPQESHTDLMDSDNWTSAYLWEDGRPIESTIEQCPTTTDVIEELPLTKINGFSPSVLFSKLAPGARIEPHTGLVNTRLICHLPLIVPEQCGLRVGPETRITQRGSAWAFDDSIQHEAWNRSEEARVILLFDVWRPELDESERLFIRTLLESVKNYAG
ncbi:MAG: aspartyl/asparaginyl beta-hydroxylase domain-containing protein [Halieaceae bacterium]|jgi:aspartyl/asparaginyl beta-hydroxylase (cupin superfamily)|nr:aspartyl/asparaginyl beta-hydroxylase domain-containing protein [Halieaceae bacterium]